MSNVVIQPPAAVAASSPPAATTQLRPLVLVDGRCDPALSVRQYEAQGPLDQRRATLDGPRPAGAPQITVAVAHALSDGSVAWEVLLHGRAVADQRTLATGTDRGEFVVVDDLAQWYARSLTDAQRTSLRAVTTLGGAIELLSAWSADALGSPLRARLSSDQRERALALSEVEFQTVGSVMRAVIQPLGMIVQTSLLRVAGEVRRVTWLMPTGRGRPAPLPWPRGGVGRVSSLRTDAVAHRARLWIARGDRPRLEDTFTLSPAWDANLEAQPDADYDPATSSDFSRFGRVFRAWVLNEDAAYPGPIYDATAAFKLATPSTACLRFEDCLAADATGRRLSPVVQYSTDAGETWQRFAGGVTLMNDRAGLTLDEPTLPAGLIDAGQAGDLRLRITATLIGPDPITSQRWRGNPFVGIDPPVTLDHLATHRWDRVAPGSLHAGAIATGTLSAAERDDRPALFQTLLAAMRDRSTAGEVELELFGAWPGMRVGDRVRDPLGDGVGIDGVPVMLGGRPGTVDRVRVVFGGRDRKPVTRAWVLG